MIANELYFRNTVWNAIGTMSNAVPMKSLFERFGYNKKWRNNYIICKHFAKPGWWLHLSVKSFQEKFHKASHVTSIYRVISFFFKHNSACATYHKSTKNTFSVLCPMQLFPFVRYYWEMWKQTWLLVRSADADCSNSSWLYICRW